MAQGYEAAAVRDLGRLYDSGTLAGLGEADLLGRFAAVRDELAFEALVVRHGPMVRGVCRGVLGDPHAADDAFQATFLVLARRSATIRRGDRLGPWLHRVATRVALRSRAIESRRSRREAADPDAVSKAVAPRSPSDEVVRIVHEEIDRLPEKYRRPVVLCYLEGRSHAEAAGRLDWPLGSVKGRLARARDLLKRRLERRGLAAPAGVASALFAADASAAVPPELVNRTVQTAVAAGRGAPLVAGAGATAAAILLAQGALTTMRLQRIAVGTLVATTLAGLLTGSALIARAGRADDPAPERTQAKAAPPALIDEELARLAGRYEQVTSHYRGKLVYSRDVPTKTIDPATMGLVIRGNEFFYGSSAEPAIATIDPSHDPKWIDLKPTSAGVGPITWVSSEGIYKLEGDTLTLSHDREGHRPDSFSTSENTRSFTDVYRRVGPAPAGPAAAADPAPVEAATSMLIEPDPAGEDPAAAEADLEVRRLEVELLQLDIAALKQQITSLSGSLQRSRSGDTGNLVFGALGAEAIEQARERAAKDLATTEALLDSMRQDFRAKTQELARRRRELAAAESQAKRVARIDTVLRETRLAPGDRVRVEVLEALPGRPLTGVRVVRPDGTISLDFYGDLMAAGLSRNELKVAVVERLRKWIPEETLGLTATHADGTVKPVAPADSDRVFVDDVPDAYPLPEGDSSRIDALERTIQALLRRLDSGDRVGPEAPPSPRRLDR